MSADDRRGQPGGRVRRALVSLVLIAAAGALAFKGTQLARFGALEWRVEGDALSRPRAEPVADTPLAEQAPELRAALARWRDEWGLRDKARLLTYSVGQRLLSPPAPDGIAELVAAIEVDPVRSASWMDLAELTWPTLALRPAALTAWNMSRVTGPYEYDDMLRRTQFLARHWLFAGAEEKRQFSYEISLLLNFPDPFLPAWQRLLHSLPAPQRKLLQDEVGGMAPLYRR